MEIHEVREYLASLVAASAIGAAVGFLLLFRSIKSVVLVGFGIGLLIRYLLPTADLEHRSVFTETRDCALNVVHFAILGTAVGLLVDICLRPPIWDRRFQFSLRTLLWFVTVFSLLCGIIIMYVKAVGIAK